MDKIKIRIVRDKKTELPSYASEGAAGCDIYSNEDICILPHTAALVSTGLWIEIPAGYEAQIRPRSGLALKHSITVLNTPGTVDADYRGEIKAVLINHGKDAFVIERGMRVAQMIIARYVKAEFKHVEELDKTKRGVKGFGS